MTGRFKYRHFEKEMMDDPGISNQLLNKNFKELEILNRISGSNKIIVKRLQSLLNADDESYHIVDLGCGSGDTLREIAGWARQKGLKMRFTGIDNNPVAIQILKEASLEYPEIEGVCSDYKSYLQSANHVDVFFASLFCHHLPDTELQEFFQLVHQKARVGFLVSDLIRSRMAYVAVKLFTRLANATPLAKNDGPVSVLNGFTKNEVIKMMHKAGINRFEFKRIPLFRFTLTAFKS